MNNYKELFISTFSLTSPEIEAYEKYKEHLEKMSQVMNLTTIKGDDIYIKHFYDSLLLYKVNPNIDSLMDVGTGAGFPGVVYAIKNPDAEVLLVEPIKKRCLFLQDVEALLSLKNTKIYNARIEDLKEKVNFATSRAVAKINILLELIIPRLNVGGVFYCLKSGTYQDELKEAQNAINELSVEVEHIYRFSLPAGLGERVIIAFKKQKETKNIYPRKYANIVKKPL